MVYERLDDGRTPLIDAVRARAYGAVTELLDLGADPNADSETFDNPLHCAISAGHVELVRALLSHGAKPNYTTYTCETALDALANKEETSDEIRALLLEHGLAVQDS